MAQIYFIQFWSLIVNRTRGQNITTDTRALKSHLFVDNFQSIFHAVKKNVKNTHWKHVGLTISGVNIKIIIYLFIYMNKTSKNKEDKNTKKTRTKLHIIHVFKESE